MPLDLQTSTGTTPTVAANQISPSLSDESNSKNLSEGDQSKLTLTMICNHVIIIVYQPYF